MKDLTTEELLKWQALEATISMLDTRIGILKLLSENYRQTDFENNESFWKNTIESLNSKIFNLKKKRTEFRGLFKEIDSRL